MHSGNESMGGRVLVVVPSVCLSLCKMPQNAVSSLSCPVAKLHTSFELILHTFHFSYCILFSLQNVTECSALFFSCPTLQSFELHTFTLLLSTRVLLQT